MSTRVNATLAGCLVGYSEKTMRKWFRSGVISGAEKVNNPGRPEEWEIELGTLVREAARFIDPERLRVMAQFIDLARGTGGTSGPVNGNGNGGSPRGNGDGPLSERPSSASSSGFAGGLPFSSGRSPYDGGRLPGSFRNATEGARWLVTHGIHAESTPKSWPGWPPSRLDPASVLALAIERQDIGNWRITWRLSECNVPSCVCHTML